MSARDGEQGISELKRDARRLITQLVSGDAKRSDFDAANRWRRQSPDHDAAFAEATRLWQDFGAAGRALVAHQGAPAWIPPPTVMSRRTMLGGGAAMATAVAAYGVIKPPLDLWPSFDELRADYRTATGEQRGLTLADDVSVRLNTQTAIAIPAPTNDRDQVTLIAGEASFVMPLQSTRALAVMADAGVTVANRARFDIRNVGQSVCVTCFDGDVQVLHGGQRVTVGIDRQLRYNRESFGLVVAINPADAAAWRDGILIFRDTPLSDVIAEFNRYRPGKIVLIKSGLAQKSVNGRFRIDRIDDVIAWLAQVYGAKQRSLPGSVMLLS